MLSFSVMSNSFQPYGPWPTRHLCPWDSPGKNIAMCSLSYSSGYSWSRDWTGVSCTPCIGQLILLPLSHLSSHSLVNRKRLYIQAGFLIRIKACDNLSFFLLLQSFKRVKLLRLVGLLILMSLSGPFNLATGGLLLLLPWLPNVLPFGTLRRSWKLEFCLQEIGDQKASMPRNPTGLCLASQSILLPFKELKTNLRLNTMSPAYHPCNPIFCCWVGLCYLLVFCPEAKLW